MSEERRRSDDGRLIMHTHSDQRLRTNCAALGHCTAASSPSFVPRPKEEEEKGPGFSSLCMRLITVHRFTIVACKEIHSIVLIQWPI